MSTIHFRACLKRCKIGDQKYVLICDAESALSNQVLTWGRERLFKARLSYPLQGEGEGGA